jgi:hypothetical protein
MAFANIKNQLRSALKQEINKTLSKSGINISGQKKGTITEMLSSINRSGGMARANKYEIQITPPNKHPIKDVGTISTINLHCSTITMPGHNLEQQVQRLASAPAREIVTSHTYAGNISASFYLDANLETKSWFDAWQELSFNHITHKARYYDDYTSIMDIYQLGADGERTYGIRCDEVYPATIGQIEYSYESTDTIATLPIEFAYRKWTDIDDLKSGVPFKDGLPQDLLGLDPESIARGLGFDNVSSVKSFLKGRI